MTDRTFNFQLLPVTEGFLICSALKCIHGRTVYRCRHLRSNDKLNAPLIGYSDSLELKLSQCKLWNRRAMEA